MKITYVTFLPFVYLLCKRRVMNTVRSNEVHNLKELYECYSGSVFGYLVRLSGESQVAEELTEETFTKAIIAIDGFRGDSSIKTWLLRIARNEYLQHIRRKKSDVSLERLQEVGVVFADNQKNPETQYISLERSKAIRRAFLVLSESDRSILLLSVQEEMKYQEIAEVLGISVTAVKVRCYRARRRLAAALVEEGVWISSYNNLNKQLEDDRAEL